ncbi:hypothetical protein D3C75_641050 [compost metagenome]
MTTVGLNVATNSIDRTFANHAVLNINAAHPGLRSEWYKGGMQVLHITFAQVKALFCQHHNAAAFRCFIGKRRKLRRIGQCFFINTWSWQEIRGLAVAKRNGAGFIQQQNIYVASRFYGTPAGGNHVCTQHTAHTRHANG